jgi:hypothetical protein
MLEDMLIGPEFVPGVGRIGKKCYSLSKQRDVLYTSRVRQSGKTILRS